MEDINKRIEINNKRVLNYRVSKDGYRRIYTISEGFFENNDIDKTYSFTCGDDFCLNGWSEDESENELSFEFDIEHPLYLPLIHLLNGNEKLIIDDDDTNEEYACYLVIQRDHKKILMKFIDNKKDSFDKFHVFIKNIVYDLRSKIDQNNQDTKCRLLRFFDEVHGLLKNDYYQVSMEEHLLHESTSEDYPKLIKGLGKMNK